MGIKVPQTAVSKPVPQGSHLSVPHPILHSLCRFATNGRGPHQLPKAASPHPIPAAKGYMCGSVTNRSTRAHKGKMRDVTQYTDPVLSLV